MTHDRLQYECFFWMWNEYPDLRYLCHANINSHPKWKVQDMSKLKSLGLVKGVLDLEFYYKGCLHVFDIKIGADKLSKQQKEYIKAIEGEGGQGYEIRSLEGFQNIINGLLR